jgi:putative sterol carrier protein
MLQKVSEKWKSLSLFQKTLFLTLSPLVVLLALTGLGRSILAWLELLTRKKVDDKDKELSKETSKLEEKTKKVSENIEKLEKEKKDAADKAKDLDAQQAVDFWNSRPKPPGQ